MGRLGSVVIYQSIAGCRYKRPSETTEEAAALRRRLSTCGDFSCRLVTAGLIDQISRSVFNLRYVLAVRLQQGVI